jgi:arginine/ornithine transport system permease protein
VNFEAIVENLPMYLSGLGITLKLLSLSLACGLALALPLAVVRTVSKGVASRLVWAYTYVFRGTPMLVQLFLVYYGLAQFDAVRESVAWPWLSSATFCAWLTFTLNTAAYTTEIIAGSIRALPAHRAARRAAPRAAGLWQRGHLHAARHLAGQRRHAAGPDRSRPRRQRQVLPAL